MGRSRCSRVLIWSMNNDNNDHAINTQRLPHCGELATQTLKLLIAAAPDQSRDQSRDHGTIFAFAPVCRGAPYTTLVQIKHVKPTTRRSFSTTRPVCPAPVVVIHPQQLSQAASRQSPQHGSMCVAHNVPFKPRERNGKAHTLSVSRAEIRSRKSRWRHGAHQRHSSCQVTRV